MDTQGINSIERIQILGVNVDVCKPEELENAVLEILASPGTKQIVFLSIWDLLKARKKKTDFAQCINSADLILPVSKSIISGAKFLKKNIPVRYNPFDIVINILSIMENHGKSLYLLGGMKKSLMKAESNIRETYPELQIVGRYVGYYPKQKENDIVQGMFKASPSLVILGDGIKEKNLWPYNRRNSFSSSIFLYYKESIGIFSERIKRVGEKTFEKGHEIFWDIAHNPLNIFLVFPYIRYIILLVWYRLFKKKS